MAGGLGWRVAVSTVATAVVSSGVAVVVNLATEWGTNVWAWAAVVVLTLVAAALSLWLARRSDASTRPGVSMSGSVGRDNIQLGQVGGSATVERGP
ncbi:MAG: hypothetical protein ACRDRH_22815 [Pseudonocardia sp.]